MTTPVVIDGNPNTYVVTTPGVAPGSIIVDMSGGVPGVAVVERTNPTTNVRVVLAPASAIPVIPSEDLVVPSSSSTGPGNITLTLNILQGGVPAADRGVSLALEADNIVGFTPTVGSLVVQDTAVALLALGRASVGGVVAVEIDGPAGTTIEFVLQTNGTTGITDSGSVVLPV